MPGRYNEAELTALLKQYPGQPAGLVERVYTTRLIGQDSDLVLHGGGNASVKIRITNLVGEEEDVLFVKGSGWDMGTIEPQGFTGMRLAAVRKLLHLNELSDDDLENQMLVNRIDARAPFPSLETMLHAYLPHKFVDHSHADVLLALSNQIDGAERVAEALGSKCAIIPYRHSGLPLVKAAMAAYEGHGEAEAIVFLHHGIFTFADEARASYEAMMDYVDRAEAYLKRHTASRPLIRPRSDLETPSDPERDLARVAQVIRGACSRLGPEGENRRLYVDARTQAEMVEASLDERAPRFCQSGVITPDHAIRTKNHMAYLETVPETDEDLLAAVQNVLDGYSADYRDYFSRMVAAKGLERSILPSYPRLVLVAGIGLLALGATPKAAKIAADLGEHNLRTKLMAEGLGHYEPLSEADVFDMEYWSLELKKLGRTTPPPLEGQVALITGGGGAIGMGVADCVLSAGAAVVVADFDQDRLEKVKAMLSEKHGAERVAVLNYDVTDYAAVENAYRQAGRFFGGLDLVVPNAGVAHVDRLENLDPEKLDFVIAVNMKGTFNTIKAAIPVLRRQGTGGNIVIISTKNVFDPGAAFGAYSASKAGAHQLGKIAALELAEIGVRVNMINPDAIFGDENVSSKLWDLIGPERMRSRGLDAEGLKEYYRRRNLLQTRVFAEDVGRAVVFFAAEAKATTGASLPVDGGNSAAFPR